MTPQFLRRAMSSHRAFTLIEVVVAFALLATISAGVVTSLLQATRARVVSRNLTTATQLAADGVEHVRSGAAAAALPTQVDGFERRVVNRPWPANPRLREVTVIVAWNDGRPQQVELHTLISG